MNRLRTFLPLAAIVLVVSPAITLGSGFSYRGIRLGMTVAEFADLARSNKWKITSYTTVDGRLLTHSIEYKGVPVLDSLTDVVTLNVADPRLGCVKDTSQCADFDDINLKFRFGQLRTIELLSPLGTATELKVFALVVHSMMEQLVSPGKTSTGDIETFFQSYNPASQPMDTDAEIARWVRAEAVGGQHVPVNATLAVFRAFEKYDFYDDKGTVMWPRGICRVLVSQSPKEVEEKWAAVRKHYDDTRAAEARH